MDFVYDNSGKPFALTYTDGTAEPQRYYYVLNIQGDVIALMTASRQIVARYTYNAWGKVLSVTNANGTAITSASHIANLNPIRYRGYYYDTETGFYYLQSRYYDPANHRFINADGYASTGQGFLGYNMFAYCNNNPVILSDSAGRIPVHHNFYEMSTYEHTAFIERAFYYTVDDAAIDAGTLANNETEKTNVEHICGIYEVDVGNYKKYFYGEMFAGYHDKSNPDLVLSEADAKGSKYTLVAVLHSHGLCNGPETIHFPVVMKMKFGAMLDLFQIISFLYI